MERLRIAVALLCSWPLLGQGPYGTTPKPKAADYPAHVESGKVSIGAEYLVHSVPVRGNTFVAQGYLVVEVAVYPPRSQSLAVASGDFRLRINGKKVIYAESPGFVAASLKYPDWERRPGVEVGGGVGDAGVILGRPERVGRFPGDPSTRTRLPAPPRAPEPQNPSGMEKEPPLRGEDAVMEAALADTTASGPVSGYLYFAYKGKMKAIKELELLYEGPAGKLVVPLPQ